MKEQYVVPLIAWLIFLIVAGANAYPGGTVTYATPRGTVEGYILEDSGTVETSLYSGANAWSGATSYTPAQYSIYWSAAVSGEALLIVYPAENPKFCAICETTKENTLSFPPGPIVCCPCAQAAVRKSKEATGHLRDMLRVWSGQ